MSRTLTRLARTIVASALLLSFAGVASAADTAKVRVLHASPDAPAVDVYLDDTQVSALTNVPFGVISGYLAIPAGAHNVKVYPTGTTTSPVIDANLTLTTGKMYTIAATGAVASITAQVIEDVPAPTCSAARVRVIHFSADAPAVDVAVTGTAPADAVVKNLAYPTATGYLELPGGTYDLEVRLAGTTTVALPLPNVAVTDCNAYSVFAIGSAAAPPVGGNALQVAVALDATATIPAAPATDVAPTATSAAADTGAAVVFVAGLAVIAFFVGLSLLARRERRA